MPSSEIPAGTAVISPEKPGDAASTDFSLGPNALLYASPEISLCGQPSEWQPQSPQDSPHPRGGCDLSNAATVFAQGHGSWGGGAGSTLRGFQLLHRQGLTLWLHGAWRCVRWLVHPGAPLSRRGALWEAAATVPDLAAELLPRSGSAGADTRQEPGRDGGWAEGSTGEVMGRKSPARTALNLQFGRLTGTEDTGSSPPVP